MRLAMRASLLFLLLWSTACTRTIPSMLPPYDHSERSARRVQVSVTGSNAEHRYVDPMRDGEVIDAAGHAGTFDVAIDPGASPIAELYFVFTNPTLGAVSVPKVSNVEGGGESGNGVGQAAHLQRTRSAAVVESSLQSQIARYNRQFSLSLPVGASTQRSAAEDDAPHRSMAEIDTQHTFYADPRAQEPVVASARWQTRAHGVTLTIWVADAEWCRAPADTGVDCLDRDRNRITRPMVAPLGEKFLKTGEDNDIYEWMLDVFGPPWGAHRFSDLISATAGSSIDILLFDIDPQEGINDLTAGFFYSKDLRTQAVAAGSNERLILYLDAPRYAMRSRSGAPWSIDSAQTRGFILTLVHELQHMMAFYQRRVVREIEIETWLDEMLSEAAVDLLARRLGIANPQTLRLRNYNCHNDESLVEWKGSLRDYATSYAFGAYLMRNYGVESVLQAIYRSRSRGLQAVTEAVSTGATTVDAATLLRNWGVAGLLSDRLQTTPTRYNSGVPIVSQGTGASPGSYPIDSINLYDDKYACADAGAPEQRAVRLEQYQVRLYQFH